MNKTINWEPGMKEALKIAGTSGKQMQSEIDKLVHQVTNTEDYVEKINSSSM